MRAKTFLEIHDALLNKKPLAQRSNLITYKGLYNGLCGVWIGNEQLRRNSVFKLIIPTYEEIYIHGMCNHYWCVDRYTNIDIACKQYNELRQNIILLCAAINGEL